MENSPKRNTDTQQPKRFATPAKNSRSWGKEGWNRSTTHTFSPERRA